MPIDEIRAKQFAFGVALQASWARTAPNFAAIRVGDGCLWSRRDGFGHVIYRKGMVLARPGSVVAWVVLALASC